MKKEDIKIIEMTFVNAFLAKVKGGFILIDTGLSMFWEKLESELIAAGCFPDKIKLVIITHGDFDHTGNCLKLQEKYKLKIAMHKDDSAMAENGVFQKRKVRKLSARIFMFIRKLKKRKFDLDKFKPDLYLTDGQDLSEYGWDAKIIHIPGHTKGSIGILTNDGILFAGDMFTNRKKPDTATYIENQADLETSYARLKAMNIKTVYPGHGRPFEMEEIASKL
jgi:glyoxylase-like metal-dependent hydrolase (beta-lactamase superfamily II)